MFGVAMGVAALTSTAASPVHASRRVLEVAPVWTGHPVGFQSVVAGNRQVVAFFDAERRMTVAARELEATNWTFQVLPEKLGWDSHNYVTLAVDQAGHLHLSGNMHGNPLVYFRTSRALDIRSFERVSKMTGRQEQRVTYPRFLTGPGGDLIFTYRDGGSGNGDQIYNIYDARSRSWRRLLDGPLISGEGRKSAYLNGPLRGPDDFYHLVWIWRETPDCATSHQICYARSRDLVTWETSGGRPLPLPITFETGEVVDPVPMHGGAINGNVALGFDAQGRPIVSYHKFDTNGFTQVYNTRLEDGRWVQHQATDWKHRWEFGGGGSIPFEVRVGPVKLDTGNRLTQHFSSREQDSGAWVLDDRTLRPRRRASAADAAIADLRKVRSAFPGMQVHLVPVQGSEAAPAALWLRWETLGANRDRPRPGPLPPPGMLEVYEIPRTKG
ncbi:MAG TPA: BNR repeat-containing protein [Verrucomicrobiota bacterium]|nr:BNR repeat-containing protein [Verrucomicrobiota bacterium]